MSQASAAIVSTDEVQVKPAIWRREAIQFLLLFLLVWVLLESVYVLFPLIRPGADIVLKAKSEAVSKPTLFTGAAHSRVLICGNSRILAGFHPAEFDAAFANGAVRSFNLGLPGETRFLPTLEAALAAGNRPTHVLLTLPWDGTAEAPSILDTLRDDANTISWLFPFRHLPRDAVLFASHAGFHPFVAYRSSAAERDKMLEDRGYYFIHAESYYPGNRLPNDFALPTDHPDRAALRVLPEHSLVKERLLQLATQYHFDIVFVPIPMRVGEVKSAFRMASEGAKQLVSRPNLRVAGPAAFTYLPKDFADPIHMNPDGAKLYTADLAHLLAQSGVLP